MEQCDLCQLSFEDEKLLKLHLQQDHLAQAMICCEDNQEAQTVQLEN